MNFYYYGLYLLSLYINFKEFLYEKIFLFLSISFLLTNCTTVYIHKNAENIPLLEKSKILADHCIFVKEINGKEVPNRHTDEIFLAPGKYSIKLTFFSSYQTKTKIYSRSAGPFTISADLLPGKIYKLDYKIQSGNRIDVFIKDTGSQIELPKEKTKEELQEENKTQNNI